MDALVKYLSHDYHVLQLTFFRFFFHLTALILLSPAFNFFSYLKTSQLKLNLVRALSLLTASVFFYLAVSYIPLAEANAITFVAPLLMTVLSIPLHGARVDARRWLAVSVGFAGALIIIRPGWGLVHWAAFLPLVVALNSALYHLTTPILGQRDNPLKTLYYTGLVGSVLMALALPWVWRRPTMGHLAVMAVIGLLGLIGHFLLISAFNRAPTPALSPFLYSYLVWAVAYDYILFQHSPDLWLLAGAAAIIGGGMYLFYKEAKSSGLAPAGLNGRTGLRP
jgi:drug/metabolite transporter (DMT)-like permease